MNDRDLDLVERWLSSQRMHAHLSDSTPDLVRLQKAIRLVADYRVLRTRVATLEVAAEQARAALQRTQPLCDLADECHVCQHIDVALAALAAALALSATTTPAREEGRGE